MITESLRKMPKVDFSSNEGKSWTLSLHRCFIKITGLFLGNNNITDTHINGMVDYTLWFIISHLVISKVLRRVVIAIDHYRRDIVEY